MTTTPRSSDAASPGFSNRAIVLACVGFVAGMGGMAYAAVPLYQLFCQVTGYGGTTQRVEQVSDVILDREIVVRFDANVAGDLPWDFKPIEREVRLKIGETTQVAYEVKNLAKFATSGTATFNVTPQSAGAYFNKIECFCFTENQLTAGESMEMPVVFFVDPDIVDAEETKNLTTITLSYTFFGQETEKPVAAAIKPGKEETDKL